MNYKEYLDSKANEFLAIIEQAEGVAEIPTKDYGWENYRYESSYFRLAHVERYSDDKVEVLHVTTFPRHTLDYPIFGFDVIAVEKKVLGCYMDLSPANSVNYNTSHFSIPTLETFNFDWKVRKEQPKWTNGIFSDSFMLIEPSDDVEFLSFCVVALHNYMNYVDQIAYAMGPDSEEDVIKAQNKYCEVQASNPRTYGVLKSKIGEEEALDFMQNVLFPKIIT